jgi:hypothetical protein
LHCRVLDLLFLHDMGAVVELAQRLLIDRQACICLTLR